MYAIYTICSLFRELDIFLIISFKEKSNWCGAIGYCLFHCHEAVYEAFCFGYIMKKKSLAHVMTETCVQKENDFNRNGMWLKS